MYVYACYMLWCYLTDLPLFLYFYQTENMMSPPRSCTLPPNLRYESLVRVCVRWSFHPSVSTFIHSNALSFIFLFINSFIHPSVQHLFIQSSTMLSIHYFAHPRIFLSFNPMFLHHSFNHPTFHSSILLLIFLSFYPSFNQLINQLFESII